MSRPLALLVNPAAAGGKVLRALALARTELDAAGADYRVVKTGGAENAAELASAAAAAGEAVVAVGGDGTVGCIAGALCDAAVPLGILPSGRGNDFARVLGLPLDARSAARVLMDGRERLVDVGDVDGRPFVGIASMGIDSEANQLANDMRLVRGNLVYAVAALRTLAAWRHANFTVTVDGVHHESRGFSVAVGNSKSYGGGMLVIPHAELDDGRLDVFLVGAMSKLRFLRGLPKLFKGSHVDSPWVSFMAGEVVKVEADRPFTVYADGEPAGELPVTVRVRKHCLRVLVPRG